MASTVWKGHLGFGLVNIPVRLQRAARKERIPLRYLKNSTPPEPDDEEPELSSGPLPAQIRPPVTFKARSAVSTAAVVARPAEQPEFPHPEVNPEAAPSQVSRIKQSIRTADDKQIVPRDDLMRGYEVAPDQFVTFRSEELRRLRPATSTTMEIVRAVRFAEIDPVFLETSYYVVPEPAGERAYALLFLTLRDTGYVALATFAMHGREHVVIVRPGQRGLIAHTMYYVDEIRAEDEYRSDIAHANPKELELAKTFTEALAGPFAPEEFSDKYRQGLRSLISAKTNQNEVAGVAPVPSAPSSRQAPVSDIMYALRKSLEIRKPPSSERTQAEPAKVTELKRGGRKHRA